MSEKETDDLSRNEKSLVEIVTNLLRGNLQWSIATSWVFVNHKLVLLLPKFRSFSYEDLIKNTDQIYTFDIFYKFPDWALWWLVILSKLFFWGIIPVLVGVSSSWIISRLNTWYVYFYKLLEEKGKHRSVKAESDAERDAARAKEKAARAGTKAAEAQEQKARAEADAEEQKARARAVKKQSDKVKANSNLVSIRDLDSDTSKVDVFNEKLQKLVKEGFEAKDSQHASVTIVRSGSFKRTPTINNEIRVRYGTENSQVAYGNIMISKLDNNSFLIIPKIERQNKQPLKLSRLSYENMDSAIEGVARMSSAVVNSFFEGK